MAEKSMLWNTGGSGDGAATYTQAETTRLFGMLMTDAGVSSPSTAQGVLPRGTALAVTAGSGVVVVAAGAAFVAGFFYWSDANVNVTIPTPAAATRIDRIVLRASYAAGTVRITRIAGTEGAGAPALVQTLNTTWDIPLAQVTITTGGVITVADNRSYVKMATKVDSSMLEAGAAVANLGYTPVNRAGDTMTGGLTLPYLTMDPTGGDEGGEVRMRGASGYYDWWFDVFQNRFRLRNQANNVVLDFALNGQQSINLASAAPPFVLNSNAQNQLVEGFRAATAATADNATMLNGEKIQRGTATWTSSPASSGTITGVFASGFSGTPTLTVSPTDPSVLLSNVIFICVATATDFTIAWRTFDGSTRTRTNFNYIAVGPA